uniref:Trafficking protein particle complex subunit n=1 Tax=Leptocylindrus danicus TaxID=163516 RepID=A0A7S2K8C0_9STRA|mmetsp:Transcript_19772/g.29395  ORF Transcript_19772/g.29395 Transcript_19772/m.29395 type:complete len:253 (+) Transcript_19772:249-1007(+)
MSNKTLANFASATTTGQTLWSKMPKANAELFALTYGSLVTEIIRDLGEDNTAEINAQLDKIGYSIGVRCVDEYLARLDAALPSNFNMGTSGSASASHVNHHGKMDIDDLNTIGNMDSGSAHHSSSTSFGALPACSNLRDTAESIAKIGFKMFLGVSCDVANYSADSRSFSLYLHDDPLATFVELPEASSSDVERIRYSNVYCGVIRGALEQVNLKVECTYVRDILRGDEANEIRVELKEVLTDGAGEDYKEE